MARELPGELAGRARSVDDDVRLGRGVCRALRDQLGLDAVPTDPEWPELDELDDGQLARIGDAVARCVTGDLPEANPWSLAYLWAAPRTYSIPPTWGLTPQDLPEYLVSELLQRAVRDLPATTT
jgi:hypothetical protein